MPSSLPVLCGTPLNEFTVVYSRDEALLDGEESHRILLAGLSDRYGVTLPSLPDAAEQYPAHCIFVGDNPAVALSPMGRSLNNPFRYRLIELAGNVCLCGGSFFAVDYAISLFLDILARENSLPAGIDLAGDMYGKAVHPKDAQSELRLMSNNTWNCDKNKDAWAARGEDCSAEARSRGLASVYLAYEPDVICFQEMTAVMIGLLQKELTRWGKSYSLLTYVPADVKPYTCILYRNDRLTLLAQGHHDFAYGNDANSKGYTWGCFELRETKKRFLAMSTHLWWKSEQAQSGSDTFRTNQAVEIADITEELTGRYRCPCFVMGDFNTTTASEAFTTLMRRGFADAFDLASVFSDDNRGYHTCTPETYSREAKLTPYRGYAIDHITVKGASGTEIRIFNHVRPYFFIRLSDHYPVYIDCRLKESWAE